MSKEVKEVKEVLKKNLASQEDLKKINDRIDDLVEEQSRVQSALTSHNMTRRELQDKLSDMRQQILGHDIDVSDIKILLESNGAAARIAFYSAIGSLIISMMTFLYNVAI